MDPNWKSMKSLIGFYPKSESNAETESNVPTDLDNQSPQQPNQLLKNRYYVTVIFDVIKFLASNELSFRGDDESYPSFGLFLRLFEFILVKDTHLQEVIKYIPKVAIYKSPEIQNEVLDMATTVC
ncbi:hypothetical protein T11_16096 [Trichinella zimbabwensis]|uniref:Uncharacterized protein n=1 Tax=Trichinella zimbabwensis TaxID=268475 RepID=A0A0V1HZI9_9BILA|nr:hypothetical protein T11_16096 [Trichinella zimbabwensis]